MLVLIDESGDTGLKFGEGSTEYFIVTLLAFNDHAEADLTDKRIAELRVEIGLPQDYEFHFSNNSDAVRERFFDSIRNFDFFYFCIVLNKRKLTGEGFKYKEPFYKYTCGLVFENAKPHLNNATAIIDGSGSREFRLQLGTYLRKRINTEKEASRYIGKVKIQDSKRNNLLQLVDMVCGAVARSYKKRDDSHKYRKMVSHREIYVQFWPK